MNANSEIIKFLAEQIPTKALLEFKASEETRKRIWDLIEKEKETGLLPEEKLELDDFQRLERLVLLAKAQAIAVANGR